MNEPVILKNSFAIGLVAMLQVIAPAVIAVACLFAVFAAYREPMLQQYFYSMALVVGLLALLFSRPNGMLRPQLVPGSLPIALGVTARWLALLGVLFAIGYVAHVSEHYARRAVLTWAAVTPLAILVATLLPLGAACGASFTTRRMPDGLSLRLQRIQPGTGSAPDGIRGLLHGSGGLLR